MQYACSLLRALLVYDFHTTNLALSGWEYKKKYLFMFYDEKSEWAYEAYEEIALLLSKIWRALQYT